MLEFDYRPISSPYIRNEFQWDYMGDVKWDILRNNLQAAQKVLENPKRFPKADFDNLAIKEREIGIFLTLNGY